MNPLVRFCEFISRFDLLLRLCCFFFVACLFDGLLLGRGPMLFDTDDLLAWQLAFCWLACSCARAIALFAIEIAPLHISLEIALLAHCV